MGCVQSRMVSDPLYNELVDHFKFLNATKWSLKSFSVTSIHLTNYNRYKLAQDTSDFIRSRISGNMTDISTMGDEIYFKTYMARRLMCTFFGIPFVDPVDRSLMDSSVEKAYFSSPEIKTLFEVNTKEFKEKFFMTSQGPISPDTQDENLVNALKVQLMLYIQKLVEKCEKEIPQFARDACVALQKQKKNAKNAEKAAFAAVFSK